MINEALLKFCRFIFVIFVMVISVQWICSQVVGVDPVGQMTFSKAYVDGQGKILRLTTAKDGRYRIWTPLREFGENIVSMILLKEDQRFYVHPGIEPVSLLKSTFLAVLGRRNVPGGSTISMQVARLLWKLETKSIQGKINQLVHALALEARYSKSEILEIYLNIAPYGSNVEGLGTASWVFFRKEPKHLTQAEALRFAIIPQSPTRRRLSQPVIPESLEYRSLKNLSHRYCMKNLCDSALLLQDASLISGSESLSLPMKAPHFISWLDQTQTSPGAFVYGKVQTTLDLRIQDKVEKKLSDYLATLKSSGVQNGSVLLVDRKSMGIKAYIGSADFFNEKISGQVDGIRAKRSPGSTLKPFIYGMALDQGLINPESVVFDVPVQYGVYDPDNFDREFVGPLSASEALIRSRNIPALSLLKDIGIHPFLSMLRSSKVNLPKSAEDYGLAMAVGSAESSMLELTRLYGALLNQGRVFDIQSIYDSESPNGLQPWSYQALSMESAELVFKMLTRIDRERRVFKRRTLTDPKTLEPLAWKTGTSFGFHDAWTMGVFDDWILGVWLGDFEGKPNTALVGRDVAAPLWRQIAEDVREEFTGEGFLSRPVALARSQPHDTKLRKVKVCALSGDRPGQGCRSLVEVSEISGVSPTRVCPIHKVIHVHRQSGQRRCTFNNNSEQDYEPKVFSVWPSNVQSFLIRSEKKYQQVPPFEDGCEAFDLASPSTGKKEFDQLGIVSPTAFVYYQNPMDSTRTNDPVPLVARALADSERLFWFENDRLIGEVKNIANQEVNPLMWVPKPGVSRIRVMDLRGRSATIVVKTQATL